MSVARQEYFADLLSDAAHAVGLDADHERLKDPQVVAALILSDALNGLRKAVLDLSESARRRG